MKTDTRYPITNYIHDFRNILLVFLRQKGWICGSLVKRLAIVWLVLIACGVWAVETTNSVLRIGISDAVVTGLENNLSLQTERLDPEIRRAREDRERARFDPGISGELSSGRDSRLTRDPAVGGPVANGGERLADIDARTTDWSDARLAVEYPWATGTRLGLETGWRLDAIEGAGDRHSVRLGLSVTQALLRGAGVSVNRLAIRQAELATQSSLHEVYGFTMALVARIETAYWNLVLAERQVEIVSESAALAAQQLEDVNKRVDAGVLASTERAAAQSEAARRDEALIRALGQVDRARLTLLHLLNPPLSRPWDTSLELTDRPPSGLLPPDALSDHVALALRTRPELVQARLARERGDLEMIRTRNGLLPRLDLFVRLGRTAYADSFGDAWNGFGDEDPDFSAGLQLTHALGRRAAHAEDRESLYLRQQADAAVVNLKHLIELDVRTAHLEVRRADEHIAAAAAIRETQAETLRAETEKFQAGRSTALLVARSQRDLMAARLAETEARIAAVKARIELYRLDGSLLERRGIAVPAGMADAWR